MKTTAKLLAGFMTASVLVSGLYFVPNKTVWAEDNVNVGKTYYYDQLQSSALAQDFYGVMEKMTNDATSYSGQYEYDLLGDISSSEFSEYMTAGTSRVPVALGAARDAYYLDHPELFYLDVFKLTLSTGMQGDNVYASLGTGRADNYYNDDTVTSAAEITEKKQAFESKVDAVVNAAKEAGNDAVSQINYVNTYLSQNITYDYGDNGDGTYDGFVRTAYALVTEKAVCSGYASAFKVIMDRLDIPCVLIGGTGYAISSVTGEAGYESHMWNAVQLNGLWYGVDVTWNATCGNRTKYLLVGGDFLSRDHYADPVISSSGYEVKYPAIRPLNYGVSEDANGFVFLDEGSIDGHELGYKTLQNDKGENYTNLALAVSYEGKDAGQLKEEGKYLAFRYIEEDGTMGAWIGIDAWNEGNGGIGYFEGYTVLTIVPSVYQIQYAVIDYAPDMEMFDSGYFFFYSEKADQGHLIATSIRYTNDAYLSYIPAPFPLTKIPDSNAVIYSFEPMDITLKYDEKLVVVDENEEISVSISAERDDIHDYIKLENVVWNEEDNSISFTFTPSKQYSHDFETYYFVPTNLVGETSGKVPEPATYTFARKFVVCPRVFNDGRLYMLVYGRPQLVGAEDMSLNDFKDKNGQPVAGNQTSQLMLVMNEVTKQETDTMTDVLLNDSEIGLETGDIKSSATYEINLSMCGCVQTIPAGSYMQVGFGFPEGYGPEDAGVSFTVYHYTRNADGTINTVEEVPCVVTECGIIATVRSFSPFMVCAVDSDKVSTTKTIYASVEGVGGSLDKTAVLAVGEEGVSYTITPDSGYQLASVMLNGEDITDKVVGGVLTLTADELDNNNVVEVSFISERVATYYEEQGITLIQPKVVVTEDDLIKATTSMPSDPSGAPDSGNGWVIAVVIIAVVVVLVGVGVAVYFAMRKRATANGAAASSAKKNTKERVIILEREKPDKKSKK